MTPMTRTIEQTDPSDKCDCIWCEMGRDNAAMVARIASLTAMLKRLEWCDVGQASGGIGNYCAFCGYREGNARARLRTREVTEH